LVEKLLKAQDSKLSDAI